jgi:ubiquinone/menaquinone biosynthesis C-methylase UbiE
VSERKDNSTTEYNRAMAARHRPAHARRTAEKNAAFLLPHLKPGMRLLDAGCGPGSITVGLAEAVAPGETVGIDADPEAIDGARALAAERGVTNVRFEVGDVYALPREDASFDAVFSNALLQHLADPGDAVREMHRVLRAGGIVAIADADHDTSIIYPPDPLLERHVEIMREMRLRTSGGDVRVGQKIRAMLVDAGFARTQATVACAADGSDERARFMGEWNAAYVEDRTYVAEATRLGVSEERELREIAAAWRRWGEAPGAVCVTGGFQCVGRKP